MYLSHTGEQTRASTPIGLLALALSIAIGAFAAWVDFRVQPVQVVALILLVGTFATGVIAPRWGWLWALITGSSIFVAHAAAPWFGWQPRFAVKPAPAAALIALIPAFIGGYAGVLVRSVARSFGAPSRAP